jgi:catechol 2,3-dioxygenase-like lactoylglutathione lyase family enzyme
MQSQGFHHLAVQVRDLERVAGFYRDVLGLRELRRHRRPDGTLRAIWIEVPGGGFIALEQSRAEPAPASSEGRPGYSLIALGIAPEERKRIAEELVDKGVAIVQETKWTLYITDPEGNQIGLSHYPDEPGPATSSPHGH